jgi:O-acetyl-ADP-ribose deacetylase
MPTTPSTRSPSAVTFTVTERSSDRDPARVPRTLEIDTGDLTEETTDAIVNPSSRGLSGGGLVDLAVRRVAGPELIVACRAALMAVRGGLLSPGQAVITEGFRLPARFVIHCVPPIYEADHRAARAQLGTCYTEALALARQRGLSSVAFPAIGVGAYGYPVQEAARVSAAAVVTALRAHARPMRVRFVLFGPAIFDEYVSAVRRELGDPTRGEEPRASS